MLNNTNKSKISLRDLTKTIKEFCSDIHIIKNVGICGDGEIYIYKGSKNVKFPLYVLGKKIILKYVGECYVPDNKFSEICGNVKIYVVDVNLKKSDNVYEVISKKEYTSLENNFRGKDFWIGNKHIYLKKLNLFGIDNCNYNTILDYFNY